MWGQRTDNRTSEVMPYPEGRASTEMFMQFDHVFHDLFQGIGVRGDRRSRTTIAAHIRRNAMPAFGGEGLHLRAARPGQSRASREGRSTKAHRQVQPANSA